MKLYILTAMLFFGLASISAIAGDKIPMAIYLVGAIITCALHDLIEKK